MRVQNKRELSNDTMCCMYAYPRQYLPILQIPSSSMNMKPQGNGLDILAVIFIVHLLLLFISLADS